ncbi:Ribose import permease protein RbsC [Baekduia alba]|uniref:ABC transporter permease n=1 Tax=Baekduia alba TaxID=2997333 RepID=UPI0023405003|nr:ABC transporter permease [Baekduia alba]WCB92101.1 Ribose import permease protein RbsC [Baekduia alba]
MTEALGFLRGRSYLFALLLTIALFIANVIAQPHFANPDNWPQQLATLAPVMLVALASTPAILSGGGGIDISVGPLAVLCNVLLVHTLLPHGIDSAWANVAILAAFGLAVGTINGLLVAVLRYEPVIATLCMFFVINGINLKVGATPKAAGSNWTTSLADQVGPVPGAVLVIGAAVVIWLLLGRTAYHRALYAVGGNDATAFSAGVNVAATRVIAYAIGGVFAAFAGIALTALVQASEAGASASYALVGITAVALGGTPLYGGRGGMVGSALGAIVLYLIQTFLGALSVAPEWLPVVYGGMLLLGVVVGSRAAAPRIATRQTAATA